MSKGLELCSSPESVRFRVFLVCAHCMFTDARPDTSG